jgi:hypothetical protein
VRGAFLVLLLVVALSAAAGSARADEAAALRVFILAGQSNMVGRGEPVWNGTGPVAGLVAWNGSAWVQASDPLPALADSVVGVGPGMTFGAEVLHYLPPGSVVGLIDCALGSTSIGDWQPDGVLYQRCVSAVRAAGGQVSGFLFLEGETEADNGDGGNGWANGFANLEGRVLSDFGQVPILLGQIGTLGKRELYQQQIRDEQAAYARAHPEVTLVTTSDLPSNGSHYTIDGYKALGLRFAWAWIGTLPSRLPRYVWHLIS